MSKFDYPCRSAFCRAVQYKPESDTVSLSVSIRIPFVEPESPGLDSSSTLIWIIQVIIKSRGMNINILYLSHDL